MMIIETPYHITFSSLNELPVAACNGKCKKVFWQSDIENEKDKCSQCGSDLTTAQQNIHFHILLKANRNLKTSDFKKFGPLPHSHKKELQYYLSMGALIQHLSTVKPEFQKLAISEWMPNGLKVDTSINYK